MNKSKYEYASNSLSHEEEIEILNPYNPNAALISLESINIDDFLFYPKDFKQSNEFDYFKTSNLNTVSLNKLCFLSRQFYEELDHVENKYYKLVDLNNYLHENKKIELIHSPEINELTIKMSCDVQNFMNELDKNFFSHGDFPSTNTLGKKILINWNASNEQQIKEKNSSKEAFFEVKIKIRNIQKVFYKNEKDKLELIINLFNPPEFSSNFLKLQSDDDQPRDYERTLFPFRNFIDPFSNLKYKNFSIFIELDEYNDMAGVNERNKEIIEIILKEREKQPLKQKNFTINNFPPEEVKF